MPQEERNLRQTRLPRRLGQLVLKQHCTFASQHGGFVTSPHRYGGVRLFTPQQDNWATSKSYQLLSYLLTQLRLRITSFPPPERSELPFCMRPSPGACQAPCFASHLLSTQCQAHNKQQSSPTALAYQAAGTNTTPSSSSHVSQGLEHPHSCPASSLSTPG